MYCTWWGCKPTGYCSNIKFSTSAALIDKTVSHDFSSGRCRPSWEYFQGSCYLFTDHLRTWPDAMKYCRDQGGGLLKVTSEEEKNFVRRSGKEWWLALRRDAIHKDIFKWNDGSLPTVTFWSRNEPNNHMNQEECGESLDSGSWNDRACHDTRHTACEKGTHNGMNWCF